MHDDQCIFLLMKITCISQRFKTFGPTKHHPTYPTIAKLISLTRNCHHGYIRTMPEFDKPPVVVMTSTPRFSVEEPVNQKHPSINSELNRKSDDKFEWRIPENVVGFGAGQMENLKIGGGVDPVFEAKAAYINCALQHIGMGKYQWKLFALCGFGWVLHLF